MHWSPLSNAETMLYMSTWHWWVCCTTNTYALINGVLMAFCYYLQPCWYDDLNYIQIWKGLVTSRNTETSQCNFEKKVYQCSLDKIWNLTSIQETKFCRLQNKMSVWAPDSIVYYFRHTNLSTYLCLHRKQINTVFSTSRAFVLQA